MKPITIELDKERSLLLDLNAMAEFEDATGKNMFKIGENFSARDLRAMLWACLVHEDEELTEKQVGKMITPDNIKYVEEKLGEVYEKQMPDSSEKKGKNAKGAAGEQKS